MHRLFSRDERQEFFGARIVGDAKRQMRPKTHVARALHALIHSSLVICAPAIAADLATRQMLEGAFEGLPPEYQQSCNAAVRSGFPDDFNNSTPADRAVALGTVKQCLDINVIRSGSAAAQPPRALSPSPALLQNEVVRAQSSANAQSEFLGLSWGIGVGVSNTDEVVNAEVRNSVVFVGEARSQTPRVILEAHYFGLCKLASCNTGNFGWGPFFGVGATNQELSGFALGLMFGWRGSISQPDGSTRTDGISVGIGAVLDSKVSRLPMGYIDGAAAPSGTSDGPISLERRSRWSPLLFFSKTF